MNALIIVGLVLIVYWKLKNQFNERITLEFKYNIYDLRDKLRDFAVIGKIEKSDWKFKYLDGSLTKLVDELETINIFAIIFITNKYKKDRNFILHKNKISKGIEENKYTQIFYEEYSKILLHYVLRKAFIIRFSALVHILSRIISKRLFETNKRRFKKLIGNVRFVPETSQAYDIAC